MLKLQPKAGFLLIELLLALALLVSLISTLGYWQWQIIQQELAVEQYLQALMLGENVLAELLAGQRPTQRQTWQQQGYQIQLQTPVVATNAQGQFQQLNLQLNWLEQFTAQRRQLTLESGRYVPQH